MITVSSDNLQGSGYFLSCGFYESLRKLKESRLGLASVPLVGVGSVTVVAGR